MILTLVLENYWNLKNVLKLSWNFAQMPLKRWIGPRNLSKTTILLIYVMCKIMSGKYWICDTYADSICLAMSRPLSLSELESTDDKNFVRLHVLPFLLCIKGKVCGH